LRLLYKLTLATMVPASLIWIVGIQATLLAILIGGFVVWAISRRATLLSKAAVAVASGQLETHLSMSGSDELSALARSGRPLPAGAAVDLRGARELIPGGEQGLRELARSMLQEYPALVARIRTSLEGKDASGLHLASHTLKGSASLFCARRVVALAERLEQMGRDESLDDVPPVLAQLEGELAQMHGALEALLEAEESGSRPAP